MDGFPHNCISTVSDLFTQLVIPNIRAPRCRKLPQTHVHNILLLHLGNTYWRLTVLLCQCSPFVSLFIFFEFPGE
jgi:hypothetical protein